MAVYNFKTDKLIDIHKYLEYNCLLAIRQNKSKKSSIKKMIIFIIFLILPLLGIAQHQNKNEIRKQLELIIYNTEHQLFSGVFFNDLPAKCDSIIALSESIKDQNSRLYGFYLKGGAFTELKKYSDAYKYLNQDTIFKNKDFHEYLRNFRKYYLGVIKYRMNIFNESMNYLKQAESYFNKDTTSIQNITLLALICKFKGRNYAETECIPRQLKCMKSQCFTIKGHLLNLAITKFISL